MSDYPILSYKDFSNFPVRDLFVEHLDEFFQESNYNTRDKLTNFISRLIAVRQTILNYFDKKITIKNIPSDTSANIFFSQLLQNLFFNILHSDVNIEVKIDVLSRILSEQGYFFYFTYSLERGPRSTVFWYDQVSGDTVLIATVKLLENYFALFIRLLGKLQNIFPETLSQNRFSQLEHYLFHENKLGRSALTMIWIKKKQFIRIIMENTFFDFAKRYYKTDSINNFQKFLFQIDDSGNTALMRVASQGFSRLFAKIITNIKRISANLQINFLQHLLLHRNQNGESILQLAIRGGQSSLIRQLFKEAWSTFGIDTPEYDDFLQLYDVIPVTPFGQVVKLRDRTLLKNFLEFVTKGRSLPSGRLIFLLKQQDAQGYTSLMHSTEAGYYEGFTYLLNLLVFLNKPPFGNKEKIKEILLLKTNKVYIAGLEVNGSELNVFQLASKLANWDIYYLLLETATTLFDNTLSFNDLDRIDANGVNTLTKIYRDEHSFREKKAENFVSPEEIARSHKRHKIEKLLIRLGGYSDEGHLVPDWINSELTPSPRQSISLFSIFCGEAASSSGEASSRSERNAEGNCFFSDSDYQASFPKDHSQRRKEALVNIISYLKQENKNPINQIRLMRDSFIKSNREKNLLIDFTTRVNHYYEAYGDNLLKKIKQNSALSLVDAFEENKPYLLVDSQHDLILLERNKLFSAALLNPTKAISLKSNLDMATLKFWLDHYFSSSYTLHPFDASYLNYLGEFQLDERQFVSDVQILQETFSGIDKKLLREFILVDGNFLTIFQLGNSDFFNEKKLSLRFRAEKFHEIYFKLSTTQKEALRLFISTYQISAASYSSLTRLENDYLRSYGSKIYTLAAGKQDIEEIELLNAAIETHEQLAEEETSFSVQERQYLFNQLKNVKAKLANTNSKLANSSKLQLLVFLFPSGIRAATTQNPLEIVFPLTLIAADTALRGVLLNFINHPKTSQLFSGSIASKIFAVASQTTTRLPVIGSVLVMHGLIQSGKMLTQLKQQDLSRAYYVHLFTNNLITMGLMAGEVVASLPSFILFTTFQLLTMDYIVNEGSYHHDVELHLQDDAGHPLLKFFRSLELGLGIIDSDIRLIQEKRLLYLQFLRYLSRITNSHENYALIPFVLPKINRKIIRLSSNEIASDHSNCDPQNHLYILVRRHFTCEKTVYFAEKADYSFVIGQTSTICDKRDDLTLDARNNPINYSLLTGTQSLDCSLGRTITTDVVATTTGEGDAGVLFKGFNETALTQVATALLIIDAKAVRDCEFIFYNNVYDIKKIQLMLVPIFNQNYVISSEKTKINIKNDFLEASGMPNPIQTIEYVLAAIENVVILANAIPEKIFSFLTGAGNLQLNDDLIESANGFQVNLSHTKKLTLEFANSSLQGFYQVPQQQQFITGVLRGVNAEKTISIDVSNADFFTINIGSNVQIKDRLVEINTQGNSSNAILQISSHNKTDMPFYQSLIAINKLNVSAANNELILALRSNRKKDYLTAKILPSNRHGPLLKIYGNYSNLLDDTAFFSSISFQKVNNSRYEMILDVDASVVNETAALAIDIDQLYETHYDRMNVLIRDNELYKLIHFLIFSNQSIEGSFNYYSLFGSAVGWIISLQHVNFYEETQIFIPEAIREITINNICYEIKPNLASLFAINTIDSGIIHGEKLIAPLKIDRPCELSDFQLLPNETYKIDHISFTGLSPNTRIYCANQVLTAAYIQYRLGFETQQAILSEALKSDNEVKQKSAVKSSTLTSFRLRLTSVLSFFLGGAIYLWSKRFRRPVLPVPTTVALPLLEIPNVSAVDNKHISDEIAAIKWIKLKGELNSLANPAISFQTSSKSSNVFFPPCQDLNSQLVFLSYWGCYINKLSPSIRLTFFAKPKKASSNNNKHQQAEIFKTKAKTACALNEAGIAIPAQIDYNLPFH